MRMSVDWSNLTLRAKDIVSLIVFVGGVVFIVATQNQKLNEIIENQSENKVLFRELGIRQSKMEAEISDIKTDQKLLKQRIDAWESSSSQVR